MQFLTESECTKWMTGRGRVRPTPVNSAFTERLCEPLATSWRSSPKSSTSYGRFQLDRWPTTDLASASTNRLKINAAFLSLPNCSRMTAACLMLGEISSPSTPSWVSKLTTPDSSPPWYGTASPICCRSTARISPGSTRSPSSLLPQRRHFRRRTARVCRGRTRIWASRARQCFALRAGSHTFRGLDCAK